jgi:magnesium transporter
VGQAQQNDITRRLAAWAAILAVPTAVAGIYGMNFENMPELKWQYGYLGVLFVIFGVGGGLFWRFRRHGWLRAAQGPANRPPPRLASSAPAGGSAKV